VYLAKPVAVDVPGCLSVEASGRKATAKQLCFLVDFQARTLPIFQDAVQQIHHFPNRVLATFNLVQVGFEDIVCRVYGTKGTVDLRYFSKSVIMLRKSEPFVADLRGLKN
jgi:hypothetical protein